MTWKSNDFALFSVVFNLYAWWTAEAQKAVAKALRCLRPPALSLQPQLLAHHLPLVGGCLIPKPIIRILLTDEETELRGKKVVTCGNSQAISGRWARALEECSPPEEILLRRFHLLVFIIYKQRSKFKFFKRISLPPLSPNHQFFQEATKCIHFLSIFSETLYFYTSKYICPAFCFLHSWYTHCSSFGFFQERI